MDVVLLRQNEPAKFYGSAFLILVSLAFIAFRDCFGIDIPTDSYPLLYTFQKYGAAGLLHNFYDVGMAPFADSVIFLLYKFFGTNNSCWIACSVLFHALNSFLLFLLGMSLLKGFNTANAELTAFLASLLFLLSPFQTEVLLWAPRMFNYQIATACFIAAFYFLSEYFFVRNNKHIYLSHLFFILAILAFESPLIFPGISLGFYAFYVVVFKNNFPIKLFFTSVLLPQVLIFVLYFCACRLWLGDWIVHYGAATHLSFPFAAVIGSYARYFAKFFLFWRYLPQARAEWLYSLGIDIRNPLVAGTLLGGSALVLGIAFYRLLKKQKSGALLCLMLFFSFMVSLVPVINLDTSFVGAIISDRYGYLPSVLFYLFLVSSIHLMAGTAGRFVSAALIGLSFFLLSETIPRWTESDRYSKKLIRNFKPHLNSTGRIYVLNLPDNFNWILTFRSGFEEYFALKYAKDLHRKIIPVASFFMNADTDSVLVEQKSATEFVVSAADGTQRFLHDGTWGRSYETPDYQVTFSPDLASYTVKFTHSPDDSRMMYVAGAQWREITH